MSANFTPSRGAYTELKPFRFWCQKVLPLVYDDSLSYYELLCKVVDYLNKTMEDTETLNDDVTNLYTAYQQLQQWVNDYYESEDFEQAIDAGLDRMAESGQLTTLMTAIINPQLPSLVDNLLPETVLTLLPDEVRSQLPDVVEDQIDEVVAGQIGSTVAGQIGSAVASQINPVVASQLPSVVSNQIDEVVAEEIVDPVEAWLFTNVTGSNAIDRTLSIVGAGADAGFTGSRIKTLDDAVGYDHISDNLPVDSFILDGQNILTDNHYAAINPYGRLETDIAYSAGTGNKARKILYIPVAIGEKYLINTHKLTDITTGTLFTYAVCTVYQPEPDTDLKLFDVANYGEFDNTGVFSGMVTIPDVTIPADHVANMLYLVVETANIEDPVYKVTDEVARESEITELKDDLTNLKSTLYHTYPGYFAPNGAIQTPSSTTNEVYTNQIVARIGYVFNVRLDYSEVRGIWLAYALYNKEGTFISRNILINSNLQTYETTVSISAENVGFIAFCYRTYNDAVFTVNSSSIGKILQINAEKTESRLNVYKYKINENVRSINHRGFNSVAPENTIPAFKLSKENGFGIVETDIRFTSDDVCVLLHDPTINRTARNTDGTTISETINISDITYEQALTYDFGIWKGAEYAGTKIPTLEELLILCKKIGLVPYIEIKGGTETQVQNAAKLVKDYGFQKTASWISDTIRLLNYVKSAEPIARLGAINTSITSETITAVTNLKNDQNDVFIDSRSYTSAEVELCKNASIPLEVWNIDDVQTLDNVDAYVSGVTSNKLVAGYELYIANK